MESMYAKITGWQQDNAHHVLDVGTTRGAWYLRARRSLTTIAAGEQGTKSSL
jgi:hypothetical protein